MLLDVFTPYVEVKPTNVAEFNVWVSIGWFSLAALGVAIIISLFLIKWWFKKGIVLVMSMYGISTMLILVGFIIGLMNMSTEGDKIEKNYDGLKVYAAETYLLTLDDTDVATIFGSFPIVYTNSDENNDFISDEVVADYYGEKVLVKLVYEKGDWLFFSDGKELPKTVK